MQRLVEIRSYRLKPGSGPEFHDLVATRSMPLLQDCGTDVVAFGPSVHDRDAYFLIRAYDDLDHRVASQDAFYSSAAWRAGPRQSIIDLIESHWDVLLWLSRAAVTAMRDSASSVST